MSAGAGPAVLPSEQPRAEPLRILVVCTANVCRSPVAERLLQRHLDAQHVAAVVSSAGTHGGRNTVHPHTRRAASEVAVDLDTHRSRPVTPAVLDTDGADLVITMTREHLRHVVALEPGAWARTFTLKELVRRAGATDGSPFTDVAAWRSAVAEGRDAAGLMGAAGIDDVADPFGGPPAGHARMVAEIDGLTADLGRLLAAATR